MNALLTPDQFIARVVGVPWARWRSDWQGADCFGLLVLYFREVRGIDLGEVPQTDIVTGFDAAHGWVECDAEPWATGFMAWRDGSPTHCGLVLPNSRLLHSAGNQNTPGSVRVSRLGAISGQYGAIKFYRYAPC